MLQPMNGIRSLSSKVSVRGGRNLSSALPPGGVPAPIASGGDGACFKAGTAGCFGWAVRMGRRLFQARTAVGSGGDGAFFGSAPAVASGQARGGPPPLPQALEDQIEAQGAEYDDPGGQRPLLEALVDALIQAGDPGSLVPPQRLRAGVENRRGHGAEPQT